MVMGRMRYWITVVWMLFAIEANGQDMTRVVGAFIAFHEDCEYERASETVHYYKCKETKTSSDFVQSMSTMIQDYESFDQVMAWTDLGENIKYTVMQNREGDREVLYDIFYIIDHTTFGISLYNKDKFSEEP